MTSPPWTEMLPELLALIAKRLGGKPEILRFRAVCKSWRSSATLRETPLFPVKLPFPSSPNDPVHPNRKGFFSLACTSTYLIQPLEQTEDPYQSLLIRVKMSKKGKSFILNPFSGEKPIGFSPKTFPKVINLLDYKVTEVGRSYSMKFNDKSKNKAPPIKRLYRLNVQADMNETQATQVKRVVLSECVIFGIYNAGNLFVMRAGDNNWTVFDDGRKSQFDDVAIHGGKCFAVDNSGTVVVLTSSLKVIEIIPSPITAAVSTRATGVNFLIESFGDLFFVHGDLDPPLEIDDDSMWWYHYLRYCAETRTYRRSYDDDGVAHTLRFHVYKLNDRKRAWDEVKSLEDRALFAGEDCRFSVLARDFAGCRGNRIYFEHHFRHWRVMEEGRFQIQGLLCNEIGACDLENGAGGPADNFPGFLDIFWPPPPWLTPNPSLFEDADDEVEHPTHPADLSFLSLF